MTKANDYDYHAAQRQKDLRAGLKRNHRFVEKPALAALLPDLRGQKTLLIGCGTGEETDVLARHGATDLTGIDLSKVSFALARQAYPEHTFKAMDMHKLSFQDSSYSFVFSSMTLHYSAQPQQVYEEVFRVLKPGGTFLFSVGHPLRWAMTQQDINGVPVRLLGYSDDESHPAIYGSYSDFAQYTETFPDGETLTYWIGPPSFHFAALKAAGFTIEEFVETTASKACKTHDPYYYERFRRFPQYTIFKACKS